MRRRLARTWRSLAGALLVLVGLALPSIALSAESAPAYAIKEDGRIWFGKTITLTRAGCADKATPAPIVELVLARTGARETLSVGPTTVVGPTGVEDGMCTWKVRIAEWRKVSEIPVALFAPAAAICVYPDKSVAYAAEGICRALPTPAKGAEEVKDARKVAALKIDVEMGDQRKSLFFGGLAVLTTIVVANALLRRTRELRNARERRFVANRPPEDGLAQMVYRLLLPATTAVGTYSLAMTQILVWSYVTLFAVVYVWCMSEGVVDISSDVLSLLGIGSATAVLSRATSSMRTYIPRRYLALVRDPDRVPRLSDLLSVDGAPNVFKLQMLVFTLVAAGIVTKEVIEKCAFPVLPAPMIALMGMSSLTYLGSEALPRDLFVDIKDRIAKIEELAKNHNLPVTCKADLEALERDGRFTGMIVELREALAEVYGGEARSRVAHDETPTPAIATPPVDRASPPSSGALVAPPTPPSPVTAG